MKVRTALIPAAGLGTRFLPATKVVPKELLPIVDRPALEYIIEELLASGITEVVLVIHKTKLGVYEHFQEDRSGRDLQAKDKAGRLKRLKEIMDQMTFRVAYQDEPKGLGHAVYCGKDAVGQEPFAVVLPDDLVRSKVPCLLQLKNEFESTETSVVAVEKVPKDRVSSYGIVSGQGAEGSAPFHVQEIVEKPSVERAPSRWAIIGRYIFRPEIFEDLEKLTPGAIGELQLTDAMEQVARRSGLIAFPFEGIRLDVGQPPGYVEANVAYAMDRPEYRDIVRTLLKKWL